MRPGRHVFRGSGPALVIAVLGLFAPWARAAGSEEACAESFERVRKAVEARSADQVVGCMAAEGMLTVSLLGLAARADPMKREQALKVLKTYFAQVSSASLKAKEGQAADSLVRSYDYTRRLRQNDPATTRLTITLKKDASGTLRLHSLVESSK
jgi:aspartokinase